MARIAIIGIGRWGKNLLREFDKIAEVPVCVSRGNKDNVQWLKKNYPKIKHSKNYNNILKDKTIDAVVIATPIDTHFDLARKALISGKHVFVEKPMSKKVSQAKKLVDLAKKKKRVLFVGHIFMYHKVLRKIKEIIRKDPVQYANLNLSKFGTFDEDIIWNLISHEVSIAREIFGPPEKISIISKKGVLTKSDVISLRLLFSKNRKCVINTNRVSTSRRKSVVLVTSRNVFLWENNSLYKMDKKKETFKLFYKSKELPLPIECKEFTDSIKKRRKPYTDGKFGLGIVEILSNLN